MSIRKQRTGENLVLGDYVAVHVPDVESKSKSTDATCDVLVQHEDFFQRMENELGEMKHAGQRAAARWTG